MTPAPKHTPKKVLAFIGTGTLRQVLEPKLDDESIQFIVDAISNHDKLVEALQHAQWGLQIAKNNLDEGGAKDEVKYSLEQISEALTAVEGE